MLILLTFLVPFYWGGGARNGFDVCMIIMDNYKGGKYTIKIW